MSCRAIRLTLLTIVIISEPFMADASMMLLIAAAGWVSLYLSSIHEKRIVTHALCEMSKAIRERVSKSRGQ
jgi:type IV secretory pathway VirB3-like protein